MEKKMGQPVTRIYVILLNFVALHSPRPIALERTPPKHTDFCLSVATSLAIYFPFRLLAAPILL